MTSRSRAIVGRVLACVVVVLLPTLTGCEAGMGRARGSDRAAPGSTTDSSTGGTDGAGEQQNLVGFPLGGPGYQGSVFRLPAGTSFGHGTLIMLNRSEARLRLDAVEPVRPTDGLQLLGTRLVGLQRRVGFVNQTSWPLPSDFDSTTAVRGAVLEPATAPDADRGYEVVLGYRIVGKGRQTVQGVRVTYTDLDSGKKQSVTFQDTLAVCVDAQATAPCPPQEADPED